MDFEAEVLNNENYDSEEEREEQEPETQSEESHSKANTLNVNVEEDEEESPVPLDFQLQGQSPKARVLRRRMSSVVVMKFNRKVDQLDAETSEKLNELLARFPYPPDHMQFQQVSSIRLFLLFIILMMTKSSMCNNNAYLFLMIIVVGRAPINHQRTFFFCH